MLLSHSKERYFIEQNPLLKNYDELLIWTTTVSFNLRPQNTQKKGTRPALKKRQSCLCQRDAVFFHNVSKTHLFDLPKADELSGYLF